MDSKVCSICKIEKPSSYFYKNRRWLSSHCKSCHKDYLRQYLQNPDKKANVYKKRNKWRKENMVAKKKQLNYSKKWKSNNKDKCYYYNAVLARDLDVTPKELVVIYDRLYRQQKGCCAICGVHQSELKKRLSIDHDHKTKTIRGLLCGNCNLGIGLLNEEVQVLQNAILYLDGQART